jgi:hypothetical protein
MEKRMTPLELQEFLGGNRRASALLSDLVESIIKEDEKLNEYLSKDKIAITTFYAILEPQYFGDTFEKFGLAMSCKIRRETKNSEKRDIVEPMLIYVCDAENKMPDVVLDMISLQKRMDLKEKFDHEWLMEELDKFN